MRRYLSLLSSLALIMAGCATISNDSSRLVTLDHYVRVKSTAPAIAGQLAQIYVREVVLAGTALRGGPAAGRRRAVRARRRHAGGSLVRRALQGLQLDGVSGARRASMCSRWT